MAKNAELFISHFSGWPHGGICYLQLVSLQPSSKLSSSSLSTSTCFGYFPGHMTHYFIHEGSVQFMFPIHRAVIDLY